MHDLLFQHNLSLPLKRPLADFNKVRRAVRAHWLVSLVLVDILEGRPPTRIAVQLRLAHCNVFRSMALVEPQAEKKVEETSRSPESTRTSTLAFQYYVNLHLLESFLTPFHYSVQEAIFILSPW